MSETTGCHIEDIGEMQMVCVVQLVVVWSPVNWQARAATGNNSEHCRKGRRRPSDTTEPYGQHNEA
jgi:hypothetical protein